jgi:hypothetical protein
MEYYDNQRKLKNAQKNLKLRPELNALNEAEEKNWRLQKFIAFLIFMGGVIFLYLNLPK